MKINLHPVLKDETLHRVLEGTIVVLSAVVIYLACFFNPPDNINQTFLDKFGSFDKELALQNIPEVVKPGSIHVPILIYHSMAPHTPDQTAMQIRYDVSPDSFIDQMQYLKDAGYTVVSLDALVRSLEHGIPLPNKSVVITFDDGWRSQFSYAFPVLHKFGYTATFFIYTDVIGAGHFLTWDQVRLMNNEGMTIGSHTESHPFLPDVTDPEVLRNEIVGSKLIIENHIHQPVYLFAYPYGHYRQDVIDLLKQAGYTAARSTYMGAYHTKNDLYTLKGIEVTDGLKKFEQDLVR